MVEMTETANILNNATPRSLVILDEIGRGTSTFDGVSLAWAIAEHIHDHVGARTLFATHYHELVDLEKTKPRLRNANVAVREHEGEIVFLHRIVPGGADQSYGIHVARLAGVPAPVLTRAREILAFLEKQHVPEAAPGPRPPGQDRPIAAKQPLRRPSRPDPGRTPEHRPRRPRRRAGARPGPEAPRVGLGVGRPASELEVRRTGNLRGMG